MSGAVVINVFPGTYETHKIIPRIAGASEVNKITFQSSTPDSTQVISALRQKDQLGEQKEGMNIALHIIDDIIKGDVFYT